MTPLQALKTLIDSSELVRARAGYFRPRRVHEVYADEWQAWSEQLKEAKKALKAAQAPSAL